MSRISDQQAFQSSMALRRQEGPNQQGGNWGHFNPAKQVFGHFLQRHSRWRCNRAECGLRCVSASRCISRVCLTLTSPHSLLYAVMMDLTRLSSDAPAIYSCAYIKQVCCCCCLFFCGRRGGGGVELFLCLDARSPQRRAASVHCAAQTSSKTMLHM